MKEFEVGGHRVRVWPRGERYAVAVDRHALARWFASEADAWAAGVREAQRLDTGDPSDD